MFFRALNPSSTQFSNHPKDWPPGAYRKTLYGQHILWHEYNDADSDEKDRHLQPERARKRGRHLNGNQLEPYRHIGDAPVDHILDLLADQMAVSNNKDNNENGGTSRHIAPGEDVLARAAQAFHRQQNHPLDNDDDIVAATSTTTKSSPLEEALVSFYKRYSQVPQWVDWKELELGQHVFLAYLPALGLSLYYRSLVPGFSIPSLARILFQTGYLAPPSSRQRVRERLCDTGALLALVMTTTTTTTTTTTDHGVDSLKPQTGQGWKACLEVRILHAKVRRALWKKKKQRQQQQQERQHHHYHQGRTALQNSDGMPINEEEMAATLLAFSVNALVGPEILLGFPLPQRERQAYLALWRYLGWLLGVRVEDEDEDDDQDSSPKSVVEVVALPRALDPCGPGWLLPYNPDSLQHSKSMLHSILVHMLHPDQSSRDLAHHLLRQGRIQEKQKDVEKVNSDNWFYYRCLQCRRFVGDPLADALGLPFNPNPWYRWRSWMISTAVLWMFSIYTFAALPGSPLRTFIVKFHARKCQSFCEFWKKDHLKRVHEKLCGSDQDNHNKNNNKDKATCHFAMLMSP